MKMWQSKTGWNFNVMRQIATMTDDHKEFLDELRESGITNMFGAAPYLREEFPELTKEDARAIVTQWMDSFK